MTATVQGGTVLVVDDEPAILHLVERMVGRVAPRVRVHTVDGAGRALEVLERMQIDLVLTDQRMPGMVGLDLLVRMERDWPDTRRVLMTGYPELEDAIRAVNEGRVDKYLIKPVDLALISSVLEELLGERARDVAQRQQAASAFHDLGKRRSPRRSRS